MIDAVFAAVIYAAGGVVAVDTTPMSALACEEVKEEVMQSHDAVCLEFDSILMMIQNGYVLYKYEPSLEGEL